VADFVTGMIQQGLQHDGTPQFTEKENGKMRTDVPRAPSNA